MATTTTIDIQLGTTFWLLVAVIIIGIVLWFVLGKEGMKKAVEGGVSSTFPR